MNLYEKYHFNRKLEKRVMSDSDFTHRYLLKALPSNCNLYKRALDIGCGTGTVAIYLASHGISVLGVDISKKAIRIANTNATNLGFNNMVKFKAFDFAKLKLNGTYDLIICSEILEHLRDDRYILQKIYKLLTDNGNAIFSIPLKSSFMYRIGLLKSFDKRVGHLRRYDGDTFINQVNHANFEILKITKNQGLLRDYLFTSGKDSIIVALANRFKLVSDILHFVDSLTYFMGYSNMVVVAKKP